jgi:hypothetical protein
VGAGDDDVVVDDDDDEVDCDEAVRDAAWECCGVVAVGMSTPKQILGSNQIRIGPRSHCTN